MAEPPSPESQGLCSGSRHSGPGRRLRSGALWGQSGSRRLLSRAGGSQGCPSAGAGRLRALLILSPVEPTAGPRSRKEAVQAALLGSRLPAVLVSERREGLRPGSQAATGSVYVQCTTEKGASGSAPGPSPRPQGSGLQRPFELVPREMLPDGGLGAGGISQFPPDHLWGGGGTVRGRPAPRRPGGLWAQTAPLLKIAHIP